MTVVCLRPGLYVEWGSGGPTRTPGTDRDTMRQILVDTADPSGARNRTNAVYRARAAAAGHQDTEQPDPTVPDDDAWHAVVAARARLAEMSADRALGLADRQGHSATVYWGADVRAFVHTNRAGPCESCLTLEALIRLCDPMTAAGFVLGPADIAPYSLVDTDDDGNEVFFWVPWRPGEAPAVVDAGTCLHARVRMLPDEDTAGR